MRLSSTIAHGELGPVVLVHGLTQTKHFWDPIIRRLANLHVHAIDARGHGETGGALDADYSVPAAAADLVEYCDIHGLVHPTLVGHSWGASVVFEAASTMSVNAVVAIDGGFVTMADLGEREVVRERLLPPRLGISREQLLSALQSGSLAPFWSDEVEAALLPSFRTNEDGLVVSTIGYERHLAVLDGLLAYIPRFEAIDATTWIVAAEPVRIDPASEYHGPVWQAAREKGLQRAAETLSDPILMRWAGAIHDVPLAWPDLVAGLIRTAVSWHDSQGGARD